MVELPGFTQKEYAGNVFLIERILASLAILTVPFQNMSFQSGPLGVAGSQLTFFPLLLLLALSIAKILFGASVKKTLMIFIFFFFALATVSSAVTLWVVGNQGFSDVLLFHKYYAQLLLYSVWLVAVFGLKIDKSFVPFVWVAFWVACIGAFFSILSPYFNQYNAGLFLYAQNYNLRPRGFSKEASDLALTIGSLGGFLYLFGGRWARLVILMVVGLFLLFIQSKGAVVAWVAAMLLSWMIIFLRKGWSYNLLVEVLVGLSPFFMYYLMSVNFESGYTETASYVHAVAHGSTSIGTRFTMAIFSLGTLLYFPLGVGFSGYLPWVHSYLGDVVSWVSNLYPNLDYSEVLSYSTSVTGEFVSAKSLFFDGVIVFGFPFVLISAFAVYNTLSVSRKVGCSSILLPSFFVFISYFVYSGLQSSYSPAFVLSAVYFMRCRNHG